MAEIETMIERIISTDQAIVLAMIVDVEGSAYRKEGSWMLFQESDSPIGMISGGCLENDLHTRAKEFFHSGRSELLSFDMSAEDDLGWGRGAGCNGVVHVVLRDVDQSFRNALAAAYETLRKKEPVLYIQSMTNFSQFTFSNKREDNFGFWDSDMDWEWIDAQPFQKIVGQKKFGTNDYFIQLIWPQPHLYIVGAGMDVKPLAQFSSEVGYAVHIFDWREAFSHSSHFPTAYHVRHGNLLTLLDESQLTPLDAVIVMTHHFQIDAEVVEKLQHVPLLYFGILGSKKRTERLLGTSIPPSIRTPVGLSIGADGAHEIAISIVADLIATRRGFKQ